MTLLEVLLAGALVFGSSAASLLLWSRAVVSLDVDARRAGLLESLEAELQAAESRLRDPALSLSPPLPCDQRSLQLVAALERDPAPAGVLRQVQLAAPAQPVRLLLAASGVERQRSYDPAAFGGCVEEPIPPSAAGASEPAAVGQPLPPGPDSASLPPVPIDAAS